MQVEESDNHALFFECKRRHFSIKNTTATWPHHKHSTGSTVLPLGLAQPKEQPRLLQQLPHFYLLPFPRKKLGYLRTWTPHALQHSLPKFFCIYSLLEHNDTFNVLVWEITGLKHGILTSQRCCLFPHVQHSDLFLNLFQYTHKHSCKPTFIVFLIIL